MSDISTAKTRQLQSVELLYDVELGSGAMVGSCLIESIRSRGGFGTVYLATGPRGEPVAVKLLHLTLTESPTALRRFQQEVEAVQRIHHPAIVQILEIGDLTDGRPFIIMEWLDGRTVDDAIRSAGAFSLPKALCIMQALCDALSAVHRAGVVHRDLKGANVMLVSETQEHAQVKLLDFGVAKLLDGDSSLTVTGARVGTPSHMAPEQILGHRVGPETDIYALGVMLFKMLTGHLPFEAQSTVEIEAMQLDAEPPRASDMAAVPEAVSDVILRCLAKKPFQRYASTADLFADLAAAVRLPPEERAALRAGQAGAIGLFVGAGDGSPAAADRLASARRTLETEGYCVALAGEHWLVGALLVPSEAAAARELRARTMELALALARPGEQTSPLSIVVHVAGVTTLLIEGTLELTGGELFDIEAWAGGAVPDAVQATPPALDGITDLVVQGPQGKGDLRLIEGLTLSRTALQSGHEGTETACNGFVKRV